MNEYIHVHVCEWSNLFQLFTFVSFFLSIMKIMTWKTEEECYINKQPLMLQFNMTDNLYKSKLFILQQCYQ